MMNNMLQCTTKTQNFVKTAVIKKKTVYHKNQQLTACPVLCYFKRYIFSKMY